MTKVERVDALLRKFERAGDLVVRLIEGEGRRRGQRAPVSTEPVCCPDSLGRLEPATRLERMTC
jgi:hypothetical protein